MAELVPNVEFPVARANINSAIAALDSCNASATPPATTRPYQLWIDTSVTPNVLRVRSADNNSWVALCSIVQGLGLSAAQIINNSGGGATGSTVQSAIDNLASGKVNKTIPGWTPLTLKNGFVWNGPNTASPAYRVHSTGAVELKGLIRRDPVPPRNTVFATLDQSLAPSDFVHVTSFGISSATGAIGAAFWSVNANGDLSFLQGDCSAFLNIQGIFYPN